MRERSPAPGTGDGQSADFLIDDTVSLVVACISNSDTEGKDVPSLIEDVHSALLGIYARAIEPSQPPVRPSPAFDVSEIAAFPEIERALQDMGASFALVRPAVSAPEPAAKAVPPKPVELRKPGTAEAPEAKADAASAPDSQPAATVEPPRPRRASRPSVRAKAVRPETPPELQPSTSPAKELLVLAEARPEVIPAEPRTRVRKKKAASRKLPRGVRSVAETVRMQSIVCLEDGRKVKDLRAHLGELGVSEEAYRRKWKLPAEYPMMAPSAILKRGDTFEVDVVTGHMSPVR